MLVQITYVKYREGNMEKYIDYYMRENNKKLKKITDNLIVKHFGWLPQMYYDDFYSIAGDVLWRCAQNFDGVKGAQFKTYLINCLIRKFKSRVTYMNRKRRNSGSFDVSLEKLIDDETGMTVGEMIADKAPVEISENAQQYLNSLSKTQRRVAEMIMLGFDFSCIKKELHLSDRRFKTILQRMRTREKTIVFDERNKTV